MKKIVLIIFLIITLCSITSYSLINKVIDKIGNHQNDDIQVELKKFTISFEIDGSVETTQEVNENEKVLKPSNPTKEGWEFLYWELNGKEYNFDEIVNSNLTLTAKWEKIINYYTIVYLEEKNGKVLYSEMVKENEILTRPSNPIYNDLNFLYWELNGKEFDFESSVTDDLVLIAKWEENSNYSKELDYSLFDKEKKSSVSNGKNCNEEHVIIPEVLVSNSMYAYNNIYIVSSINNNAFAGCSFMKSIEIPSSITEIGSDAFYNCENLINVYYDGTIEDWCNIIFVDGTSNPMYYAEHFFIKNQLNEWEEVTKIIIPDALTEINNYQFCGFDNLINIIFSESVMSINLGAFINCDGLISIEIPNSVTSIGSGAFYDCDGLISIEIPNSVTSIESEAFAGCDGLISVVIPNNLKCIESYTFSYCNNLTKVELPSSVIRIKECAFNFRNDVTNNANVYYNGTIEDWCKIVFDDKFANPMNCGGYFYIKNELNEWEKVEEIRIPNRLNSLGVAQFAGFNKVKILYIPTTIESIEKDAFYQCTSLENVYYDGSIEDWCKITFNNASSTPMNGKNDLYIKNQLNELEKLTKIIIPNTINSIGNFQFCGIKSLKSIEIHNKIKSIGDYCFINCEDLEYNVYDNAKYLGNSENPYLYLDSLINKTSTCNINKNTKFIGSQACYYNNELTSIDIPEGVIGIGSGAFRNCDLLETVLIPSSVNYIGDYAFAYCKKLDTVTFDNDNKITKLDDYLFVGCPNLTNIYLPETIIDLGRLGWSFVNDFNNLNYNIYDNGKYLGSIENPYLLLMGVIDKDIQDVTINENTKVLYDYAFYNCTSLTSIEIPNSVTNIGYKAFYNCTSLASIEIPSSVTSIGKNAFDSCYINNVYYDGTVEDWIKIQFLSIESNPMSQRSCFYMKNSDDSWEQIDGVNIKLSNQIKEIGYQFVAFTPLVSIEIPNSVISIVNGAFSGCVNLESVIFEDECKLTTISSSIFRNCENLSNIKIPTSITSIGGGAFYRCSSLENIIIPNSVTSIGGNAFERCSSLKNIVIPSSVTSIGDSAFYFCSGLKSIIFEEGIQLESIENSMFEDCSSLTNIKIPDGVKNIGGRVFYHCSSLKNIIIPNSVQKIGETLSRNTFFYCSNLTNVYYNGTIEEWCNIKFESGDSNPMSYAENFYIKNNINEWEEVTEIIIPNTITSIGDYQFYGFDNLIKIIIPNSVKNIGKSSFNDCKRLTIYCEHNLVPIGWYLVWNSNLPVVWGHIEK